MVTIIDGCKNVGRTPAECEMDKGRCPRAYVCIQTLELIEDGATGAREKPREREENPLAVSGSVVTMLRQESTRPGHVTNSLQMAPALKNISFGVRLDADCLPQPVHPFLGPCSYSDQTLGH